jgi:hypothetical protein
MKYTDSRLTMNRMKPSLVSRFHFMRGRRTKVYPSNKCMGIEPFGMSDIPKCKLVQLLIALASKGVQR